MAGIFITGSADELGRAAAGFLMGDGHDVVLHARTRERAAALSDLAPRAAGVVIGDLASAAQTRELAGQVNEIGRMDAVSTTPASSSSHPAPRPPTGTRKRSRSIPSPRTCSRR